MAPPGCLEVIYDAPEYRLTWSNHGTIGYYNGPAEDHYRNYRIYTPTTGGTITGSTVDFFPKHVHMPSTSSEDQLATVLWDLTEVLATHPKPRAPFEEFGNETNDAIRKLKEIFSPKAATKAPSRVVGNLNPRVTIQRRSPRMRKINVATIEEKGDKKVHPMNTMVRKKFGNHNHRGTVSRYDDENELYWIDYDNGDLEEMSWKKLRGTSAMIKIMIEYQDSQETK